LLATAKTDTQPSATLALDDLERETLLEEIALFAAPLPDERTRARYEELRQAVEHSEVPSELAGLLETMLDLVLPTGGVRRRHGHEGDQALQRLWQRTPRGAALKHGAQEVNEALSILRGQSLEGVSFSSTPRGHTLSIDTTQCHLTLVIDRNGVQVERVELGA
jgi:hypothetical protein